MHDGAGIAARPARTDRLALALEPDALALPAEGRVLALGAEPSAFYRTLDPDRLLCEQPRRPSHDALAAEGLAVTPDASGEGGPFALVIVTLPRQRAEAFGLVARALGHLAPGGRLVLNGAKADGVDTVIRAVAAAIPLGASLPKAHGKVAWFERPGGELPATVATWAEGARPRRNAEGFLTAPGLFSPEHVDPGSARLAAQLDARLAGRVADLGAGWGWLAARALAGSPAITALDLYEADARALACARENVRDPRAGFHWADVARLGRPGEPYDWVVTNPPFHRTRTPEPALGIAFIDAAARLLKPTGRLVLVANRQLPYEAALGRAFRSHTTLAEDPAYKVILAERPRR
jgi:16S rRNA (guanine1207-N2)-methyltransferase